MYHYDNFDAAFVAARVEQFRDQVARRLSGELTEEQFRPHRLMNGLYLQLHSYMLRIAVPYGTLNSRQVRKLAEIARQYDRGYGHFTTRQNIQFNWPALKGGGGRRLVGLDGGAIEVLAPAAVGALKNHDAVRKPIGGDDKGHPYPSWSRKNNAIKNYSNLYGHNLWLFLSSV